MSDDKKTSAENKTRSKNFSKAEKAFLIQLITDKGDVIEGPSKDFEASQRRIAAWKETTQHFADKFPNQSRTESQLRDLWRRSKIAAKSESAARKKSMRKTGGGPAETSMELTPESEAIIAVIGECAPLDNSVDDDAEAVSPKRFKGHQSSYKATAGQSAASTSAASTSVGSTSAAFTSAAVTSATATSAASTSSAPAENADKAIVTSESNTLTYKADAPARATSARTTKERKNYFEGKVQC